MLLYQVLDNINLTAKNSFIFVKGIVYLLYDNEKVDKNQLLEYLYINTIFIEQRYG